MTCRRSSIAIVIGLVVAALCFGLAGPVFSQARSNSISLNHERVDITKLIKQVGEATERTILYDDSVRGVVSIVAKRPVSLEEAWSMLDSSLAVRGYSLLPSIEGIWRVAKVADAVGESPFSPELEGNRDAYVTSLIPLRLANADAVMGVLEPLAGASVTLVPFANTNSLIASGPERRIARLTTLADAIDRVDERPVGFRVIRYRDVEEIVDWLEVYFDSGDLSRREVEVWSDERTNSVIYRASADDAVRLRELADQFDRPIVGDGKLRVLRILNRDPEEVAELIRSLGDFKSSSSRPGAASDVFVAARDALTQADFSIAVDAVTRSLIVRADADVQTEIQDLVEEVDQPPQLIAVDLKVTEVRTPSVFALGFAFHAPLSKGDEQGEIIARLVSTPAGTGLAATPSPETTLFSRIDQELNVPFTIDDGSGLAIPIANTGVITAGNRSIRTEVLIEPSLILTAGDEHEIFVGDNVPLPVQGAGPLGEAGSGTGQIGLTRQTTIERKDVGIKLSVEVSAAREGPIVLNLDVEISSLAPSLAGAIELVGPTFTEQKFVVQAKLNDGQAAIVAVNRERKTTKSRDGTPFLSAIPIIGWLFTSVVERDEDTRLIVAAKVNRVSSAAALAADTIRRRLAFERRNARDAALPHRAEGELGFAVLVTTRGRRDDADAIAESLDLRGYATEIYAWELRGQELFDVYVTSLPSMSDAAEIASKLNGEGWDADLTLLPARS